jgi:RHS repeat-associated protein
MRANIGRGTVVRSMRDLAVVVQIVALVAGACAPAPAPSPSPSPTPAPASLADRLTLEECDPAGYVPCEHQAAALAIPLAGTGVSLMYSSEWASGRTDRSGWDADALGLGGWSIGPLARFDATNGVLLDGSGSWRLVKPVALSSGERAIASHDGRRAFVFDTAGRHVRTVDAILGTTLLHFRYDAAGHLHSADGWLDGEPMHVTVERSPDGTPVRLVGPDGATTTLAVDANGHLQWTADPMGHYTLLSTTQGGLVTELIDTAGGATRFGYDDAGRLVAITDPDGVTSRFERVETPGERVVIRGFSALGRVASYQVERTAGETLRSYTGPDGTTTRMATGASGQREIHLPDGTSISLGAEPDPRWGLQAPIPTPLVERRPDGVERRVEIGQNVETPGDPLHVTAWSRTTTVDGKVWTETADPAARSITSTDPAGRRTVAAYDPSGRLARFSAPGQPDRAFTYDEVGRVVGQTEGEGDAAFVSGYSYDPASGLVTVTRPDGKVVQLGVDGNGRLVRQSAPDGSTVLAAYDGADRLVQLRPPGRPSSTLGYTAAGRSTGFLPPVAGPDDSFETVVYDQDGSASTVSGPGDRSILIGYDAAGRPSRWQFGAGTITATFDPASGLPVELIAPGGVATTIGYAGQTPASLSWSGPITGSVQLALDPELRITRESIDGAGDLAYTYEAAGLLTGVGELTIARDPASGLPTKATLGAAVTTWEYDANTLPIRQTTTVNGSAVLDRRYGRDPLGRIASVTETAADRPAERTTYVYDDADRLVSVDADGQAPDRFTYDVAGNRVAMTGRTGDLTATYDDRDRLLTWGEVRFTYRPDGTLQARTQGASTTTYDFDDFGTLRGLTLADGRRIDYVVDGSGRRIGRTVDGRLVSGYLYRPDGLIAAELDGSGSVVARFGYDDAGHLVLLRRDGRQYVVVTDQLGSPLLVVDAADGSVADAIRYDAWGNVLSESTPGFLPLGFAGGLRDPDSGLVHFGARDYDPVTGRWTGPDPIRFAGGDPNLYRYVGGDPVNRVDPTGLRICIETKKAGKWCHESDPPPPPGGSGGAGFFGCSSPGACGYTPPEGSTWYCVAGSCANGPKGFTCRAEECQGPNGEYCQGSRGAPCSIGEPHLRSADGERFDLQAAGEFVAIVSEDGSVVVQARQQPYGTSTLVSINTAVAASVAGDRVAVYIDDERPLVVDGKVEMTTDLSVRLPHGGIVERHGSIVTIDWPGGSRLVVARQLGAGAHLDYGFTPGPSIGPTLSGLLGSADGDVSNDLTGRDGVRLDPADPQLFTRLHGPFADSWRIGQDESLFDYPPGESTATFTIPGFPSAPATVDGLEAGARAAAIAACHAAGLRTEPTRTNCILDVGLTGDPSYAAGAAAVQAGEAGTNAPAGGSKPVGPSASPAPSASLEPSAEPLPSPRSGGPVTLGELVAGSIPTATSRDRYAFAATAGQIIYLAARGSCVRDLRWRLLRPDGRSVGLANLCDDLGRLVLPDEGTYTIEVFSDGPATGDYAFQLLAVPAVRTSSIQIGDAATDTIAQVGEWHRYAFAATAGQTVTIRARGACVQGLLWRVLTPDGRPVAYDRSCADLGRLVLADAGTYTIEIYSDGASTGAYGFRLEASP